MKAALLAIGHSIDCFLAVDAAHLRFTLLGSLSDNNGRSNEVAEKTALQTHGSSHLEGCSHVRTHAGMKTAQQRVLLVAAMNHP